MIEVRNGRVFVGNALEELRNIPESTVDCVITSPPYYLLRDYGGEEAECIWGGDADCKHEWGERKIVRVRGDFSNANVGNNKKGLDPQFKDLDNFCLKCGAWRGQLGHEPLPDMYVSNLADIFDEVYRVLKPSGNIFINIGDTYAGGGGTTGGYRQSWEKSADHRPANRESQGIVGRREWIKRKQLLLIPYRLAIELQVRGWIVRDMIIWAKKVAFVGKNGDVTEQVGNGLPESCTDRLTKSYEIVIHAVKSEKYYFNKPTTQMKSEGIERMLRTVSENSKGAFMHGGDRGLNSSRASLKKRYEGKFAREIDPESVGSMRARLLRDNPPESLFCENGGAYIGNVLQINTEPFPDAHFAVMPAKLVRFLMKAGCPSKVCSNCGKPYREERPTCSCNVPSCPGIVLDPFMGAGTVAMVAEELGRKWIGVEINSKYVEIMERRLRGVQKVLF